ncbi:hypothetical protein [Streptomyces sp. NBC_01643]|uniref:hypothetical protein n=1 Tax=Streptomyces sp. NBC_01643 TaxID=2975906 RepID=UPI003864571D|nr:hypothetical protein OHB03_49355 [Streptomyces sp. NBC_01643]
MEVRLQGVGCEILLPAVEEVDCEALLDLIEFRPLDPVIEEEEFGRLVTAAGDPLAALKAAEDCNGAVRRRWVNATVAHDEYNDSVLGGRPPRDSPDHSWPAHMAQPGQ